MINYRLILTDLDGTIRTTLSGKKFINEPLDQKAISGLVQQKLLNLSLDGVRICGITNQAGVYYRHKTLNDCIDEQFRSLQIFPELSSIYFCPDLGDTCYKVFLISEDRGTCGHQKYVLPSNGHPASIFRKPGAGMLGLAIKEQGWSGRYDEVLYVGDRPEDQEAAKQAGVDFVWAQKFFTNNQHDLPIF